MTGYRLRATVYGTAVVIRPEAWSPKPGAR
jgi:hypothetical protein